MQDDCFKIDPSFHPIVLHPQSSNLSSHFLDTLHLSVWSEKRIVMELEVIIKPVENEQAFRYEIWSHKNEHTMSWMASFYRKQEELDQTGLDIKEAHAMMISHLVYEKFINLVQEED